MSTKFVTLKFWMYTVPPMEHSDQLKQIGIIKSTDLHLKLYFQHFILCLLAVQLFYLFIYFLNNWNQLDILFKFNIFNC